MMPTTLTKTTGKATAARHNQEDTYVHAKRARNFQFNAYMPQWLNGQRTTDNGQWTADSGQRGRTRKRAHGITVAIKSEKHAFTATEVLKLCTKNARNERICKWALE